MRLLDSALDRTLLGYGKLGYFARRPSWDERLPRLDGKVVIVTGARTGLGKATTLGLARLGATVRMVVRGREQAEAVRQEILAAVPGAALAIDECDVSLVAAVRDYAARLDGPLHGLVHNAGVMPRTRTLTADGNELALATHVLGPHLLTRLLRDRLRGGRVVWVSSGGMYAHRLRPDDLQSRTTAYRPATVYARTKRMQVVLAGQWAQELRPDATVVHAMHPGWVDTPGIAEGLPRFKRLTRPILRTPAQGADTIVWLLAAGEPAATTGCFWHDRRPRPEHYLRITRESAADRRALWSAVEALT